MNLQYTIIRSSRRKRLTISVERDRSVVVHAPTTVSDDAISQVVTSKRQWIYEKTEHAQKYQNLPHPPGKEIVNGESALYLGKQYRIELVKGGKAIQFNKRFLVLEKSISKRREIFRMWYVTQAKESIIPRVEHYARLLGVKYGKVKVIDNRYRWGSCTVKNNVNFNWRLIKAPMFVIDYVIVHELAHLIEPNHTAEFWNIVKSQLPGVGKAKQWLKEHGQLLEQAI